VKTLSEALRAHLAQETTTLATLWRVLRVDGQVFGWCDHDQDLVIASVTYRASQGLTPTAAHSTQDFAVDTLDVTAFLDVSTETELLAGLWDNALVTVGECNWASPPAAFDDNVLILRHGNLGQVTRQNGQFTAEIRGLSQRLTTRTGLAYAPTCPWRSAQWDSATQTFVASVECGADLVGLGFIHDGTVTGVGVDPTMEAVASGQAEPEGYYNAGLLHFLTGANAGITREVRLWQGGHWYFYRPWPFAIQVGDTYRAVHGDDKTEATCRDTFHNLVNFLGFTHIPGVFKAYQTPTQF